ncbi:recombinase family protein [Vibrio fluvialis]
MTTVIYYTRFSSTKQLGGSSIERQIELCDQYRIKKGLPLPSHTYTDKAASAYHSKQLDRQLGLLINDLERGTYQKPVIVLCEALDRISRASLITSQDILRNITKYATLVTVSDETKYTHDDESLETYLIRAVKSATANEESKKKSDRAKEYWKKCREEGKAQNSVAPRYLKLNADKSTYSVIEEEAEQIKGIYNLLKAGYGIKRVHQSYQSWSPSAIARLRKDKRIVEYGIISDLDFWKVQSTLKTTRKAGSKNNKNLFRSLFICGNCGSNLVYVAPRPSRPTWSGHLMCKNRQAKGRAACPNSKNINYNKFEAIFLDFLTTISGDLFKSNQAEIEAKKTELDHIEMNYQQLEQRYNNLIDSFDMPSSRMKMKLQQLETELDDLEKQREKLTAEINGFGDVDFEHPTTDTEREEFNTKILHAFKSIKVSYPTEIKDWYTFDDKFEISGDYTQWELIHDDHAEEDPVTIEFD